MSFVRSGVSLLLVGVALSGCASSHHRQAPQDPNLGPTSMIYSPNGEPLNGGPLGRPKCDQALAVWFGRVDTDHNGGIDHGEFITDAAAQFTRMDIDHNGYLLPEELERYRLPYRQDAANEPSVSPAPDGDNATAQHRHSRRGMPTDENGASHTGGSGPDRTPDPVMSADTNNDFKVTLQEYIAQADRKFAELDAHQTGAVSLDELLKTCHHPN
jgi:Ca2+-binding EF-hand superfamily protein